MPTGTATSVTVSPFGVSFGALEQPAKTETTRTIKTQCVAFNMVFILQVSRGPVDTPDLPVRVLPCQQHQLCTGEIHRFILEFSAIVRGGNHPCSVPIDRHLHGSPI